MKIDRNDKKKQGISWKKGLLFLSCTNLVCGLQLGKNTLSKTFRRRPRVGQSFLRTPAQVGLPVIEGRPGRTRG